MTQNVLVRPISNITDPDEESVLAILAHLAPVLEDWRAGEDFRVELEKLNADKPIFENEVAVLLEQIDDLNRKLLTVFRKPSSPSGAASVVGALVAIGGFLAALMMGLSAGYAIGAAGLVSVAIGLGKMFGEKEKLTNELNSVSQNLEGKKGQLNQTSSRLEKLNSELLSRVDTFPVVTQMRGAFPISARNILGKRMLLDEAGLFSDVALSTIDLSAIQSDLDVITAKIEGIKKVPVLLNSVQGAEGDDAINTLYGEEHVLQDLVNDFMSTLGQIKDVGLNLPLIPKGNLLSRNYKEGKIGTGGYQEAEIARIGSATVNADEIENFVKQVNTAKEFGAKVLGELKDTFDSLEGICESYSFARSESMNNVHQNLFEVLNRASWCSKRFYCPRTMQSPQYLEDVLNIHPEDAHRLQFEILIANLKSDSVIANRLKDKPELCDNLYVNYKAIYDFKGDIDFDETGNPIDLGDRPAFITDQYQEALSRFRRTLSVCMTGSANPILTFSTEAEMYYDPEVDEWRSDTIPYVYNTATMLRYGQVLKVTSDLMVPLWEHLWTEKADFRKSELFRTNESLIRMTEKESEKLIEVGNQFKADMRTVRENVYLLESDLKSKYDELIAFRDGMDSLGLLSARQKTFLTDEKLRHISLGDHSVLEEGQEHETLLGLEPRVQAERRGTVGDPIDFVRSPDVLISYKGTSVKRLASS